MHRCNQYRCCEKVWGNDSVEGNRHRFYSPQGPRMGFQNGSQIYLGNDNCIRNIWIWVNVCIASGCISSFGDDWWSEPSLQVAKCNVESATCDGYLLPASSVSVTISYYAYHLRTYPTFLHSNPWCHNDIIMTSPLTYDLILYLWLHFTPLRRHYWNTINTAQYRSLNLTCSYLVTW